MLRIFFEPVASILRVRRLQSHSNEEATPMRKLSTTLLVLFMLSFLSACNTMAGAGRDVQKAGEKVEEKAEECKDGKC